MTRGITFLMVLAGLTLVLAYAGPQGMSFGSAILEKFGIDLQANTTNFTSSNLFLTIISILTFSAAGVAVGLALGYRDPVTYLLAGYVGLLINFVIDFIGILAYIQGIAGDMNWVSYLAVVIIIPICIGYVHEMVSWWSGK